MADLLRTRIGNRTAPAFAHVVALICSLPLDVLKDVLDATEKLPIVEPETEPLRRRRLEALRKAL